MVGKGPEPLLRSARKLLASLGNVTMCAPSISRSTAGVTCDGAPSTLDHSSKPRLVVSTIAPRRYLRATSSKKTPARSSSCFFGLLVAVGLVRHAEVVAHEARDDHAGLEALVRQRNERGLLLHQTSRGLLARGAMDAEASRLHEPLGRLSVEVGQIVKRPTRADVVVALHFDLTVRFSLSLDQGDALQRRPLARIRNG